MFMVSFWLWMIHDKTQSENIQWQQIIKKIQTGLK